VTHRLTILGCGSSGGVPRIAGGWGACDPSEPRNRRRRCSALIERIGPDGKTRVLIDVSPDMREQLLGVGVDDLDAVAFTHDHADHTHGIDDLRAITIANRRLMPVYLDARTAGILNHRFDYVFRMPADSQYPPIVLEHRFRAGHPFTIEGAGGPVTLLPIPLRHGDIEAYGFRIGGLVYSPDVNGIPETSLAALHGLDVWIVDALREKPHPSHFSLQDALEWIEKLKPRRAVLTNLHNDLDYRRLAARLPDHIEPAFDGFSIAFEA
jgi:phosphoribosyl 1,2-cyclic phosphate phosphodiesterase